MTGISVRVSDSELPAPGRTGDPESSDQILDRAAGKLEWFRIFTPRYNEYTNDSIDFHEDIKLRYYEQRGINFRALQQEIELWTSAQRTLRPAAENIDLRIRDLWKIWHGGAADNAEFRAGVFTKNSDDLINWVDQYITRMSDALRQAVEVCDSKQKAVDTMILDPQKASGQTAEQLDLLIRINDGAIRYGVEANTVNEWAHELGLRIPLEQPFSWSPPELLARKRNLFDHLDSDNITRYPYEFENHAQRILNIFQEEYEQKLATFILTCDASDAIMASALGKFGEVPDLSPKFYY